MVDQQALELVNRYFSTTKKVLDDLSREPIIGLYQNLLEAYENGKNVFTMGNGGSASTASHFACDINKGVCINLKKRFRVICLNDNTPTLLAYANDFSYDDVFVEQLKNFLCPGDVVIGFSGSGNSKNVLKAVEYANDQDAKTFAMAGFDGGKLSSLCQVAVTARVNDMQQSENIHLVVTHLIMQMLCNKLDPSALACYQRKP